MFSFLSLFKFNEAAASAEVRWFDVEEGLTSRKSVKKEREREPQVYYF